MSVHEITGKMIFYDLKEFLEHHEEDFKETFGIEGEITDEQIEQIRKDHESMKEEVIAEVVDTTWEGEYIVDWGMVEDFIVVYRFEEEPINYQEDD